jgi:hypothetical protein
MATYAIKVSGCDDSTTVQVELTDAEVAAVRRVADAVTAASDYGCMPRMRVAESTQDGELR